MVLLPCGRCCGLCEKLWNATSVYVKIQASNGLLYQDQYVTSTSGYVYQFSSPHEYTAANLFPGASYSGTFELTQVYTSATTKVWRYRYSSSQHRLGDESIAVYITKTGSLPEVVEASVHTNFRCLQYTDATQTFTPTANDFTASTSSTITTSSTTDICAAGTLTNTTGRRAIEHTINSSFCNFLDSSPLACMNFGPTAKICNCQTNDATWPGWDLNTTCTGYSAYTGAETNEYLYLLPASSTGKGGCSQYPSAETNTGSRRFYVTLTAE